MNEAKNFLRYHIYAADDLTPDEKIEALEGLEILEGIKKGLTEQKPGRGDDDVAAYWKHRNKLKKATGQKPVDSGVKASKKAASAVKKKSLGAKIAANIKSKIKIFKSAMEPIKSSSKKVAPKVIKGAKLAAKAM